MAECARNVVAVCKLVLDDILRGQCLLQATTQVGGMNADKARWSTRVVRRVYSCVRINRETNVTDVWLHE